jgi:hypothetical protein
MQLEQPGQRAVGEVGEDRDRPDQIERGRLEGQWRHVVGAHQVQRRADRVAQELDAGRVDVHPPELSPLRLGQEMLERAPGAAPEIQGALAIEPPVRAEQLDERGLALRAELLPQLGEALDPAGFQVR